MALIQLNVFNTLCNQYRFDAVFIQKPLKAVVSPFKGVKPEDFMKMHKNMIDSATMPNLKSFITISN